VIQAAVLAFLLAGPGGAIHWERHFDDAQKKAHADRKPIMIDFWADWCGWCHRLDQTTYVDPAVVALSDDFVALKLDTEAGGKEAAIAERYDVTSLPTILFLTPAGHQVLRLNGFQGPGQFPRSMQDARAAAERVMAWEDALARDPRDVVALTALGTHLFEQEFYEDSRDLLVRAVKLDARRPPEERKRSRMLLGIIQKYDRRLPEAESLLKSALAIAPANDDDPKILFLLSKVFVSWGRQGDARAALQKIVTDYPGSPVADKAREALVALDRQ
jgi:thioredoxin-like negative regulator of GroEL